MFWDINWFLVIHWHRRLLPLLPCYIIFIIFKAEIASYPVYWVAHQRKKKITFIYLLIYFSCLALIYLFFMTWYTQNTKLWDLDYHGGHKLTRLCSNRFSLCNVSGKKTFRSLWTKPLLTQIAYLSNSMKSSLKPHQTGDHRKIQPLDSLVVNIKYFITSHVVRH